MAELCYLAAVVDPLGQRTRFTADIWGHLEEVVDALGNTTRYEYVYIGFRGPKMKENPIPEGEVNYGQDGGLLYEYMGTSLGRPLASIVNPSLQLSLN